MTLEERKKLKHCVGKFIKKEKGGEACHKRNKKTGKENQRDKRRAKSSL